MALLPVLLLIAAHIAVTLDYFFVSACLLSIALAMLLARVLCDKKSCGIWFSVIGVGLVFLLQSAVSPRLLTYIPPILIHFTVFLIFASSLGRGKIPIITRIATIVHGELSEKHRAYTENVSKAWAFFMFLLFAEAVLAACFLPIEIWSMFVNFINYLLVILMFLAEYLLRRVVLKDEGDIGFKEYLKILSKVDMKQVFK